MKCLRSSSYGQGRGVLRLGMGVLALTLGGAGAQSLVITQPGKGDFIEFFSVPAGDGVNFVDFWIRPVVETEARGVVDEAMIGVVGTEGGTGDISPGKFTNGPNPWSHHNRP